MKKNKTLEMVQLAVLIAIMLILAFTPLGYLRIGPLAISLMTIPVVIGAMILGPAGGAVLARKSMNAICFLWSSLSLLASIRKQRNKTPAGLNTPSVIHLSES